MYTGKFCMVFAFPNLKASKVKMASEFCSCSLVAHKVIATGLAANLIADMATFSHACVPCFKVFFSHIVVPQRDLQIINLLESLNLIWLVE